MRENGVIKIKSQPIRADGEKERKILIPQLTTHDQRATEKNEVVKK
jgi:hypothetical protein